MTFKLIFFVQNKKYNDHCQFKTFDHQDQSEAVMTKFVIYNWLIFFTKLWDKYKIGKQQSQIQIKIIDGK